MSWHMGHTVTLIIVALVAYAIGARYPSTIPFIGKT